LNTIITDGEERRVAERRPSKTKAQVCVGGQTARHEREVGMMKGRISFFMTSLIRLFKEITVTGGKRREDVELTR